LVRGSDLSLVVSEEVLEHVGSLALITLFKDVCLRGHVPSDLLDSVGSLSSVSCHDDGTFEFSSDEGLVHSLESLVDE
jgi:hypothetical protein